MMADRGTGTAAAAGGGSIPGIKSKGSLDNIEEQMKSCQNISLDLIPQLNLPLLPTPTEPHLIEFLRKCFKRNFRFLTLGPLILTLNRPEGVNADFKIDVFDSFPLMGLKSSQVFNSFSPNFAKISVEIYSQLSTQSQAIFFLGESGGGKSRCLKELASHLILLSSVLRKDRAQGTSKPSTLKNVEGELKLFEQAYGILESFGHCQTVANYRSSRHSKSIKLLFNPTERYIQGINFTCFSLEHSRVVHQTAGESNFRIFYDIFDDVFFAEMAMNKYGIENITSFRYTPQRPRTILAPGKSTYRPLAGTFQNLCNLTKGMQNSCIFNILAAILHLGELEFDMNTSLGDGVQFSSDSKSVDHQHRVLKLLGISLESLVNAVTKKSLKVAGSTFETNLEVSEAGVSRDTLASQLYNSLFRWILTKMNAGLSSVLPIQLEGTLNNSDGLENILDCHPVCYLYDFMGFESLDRNFLDQLCSNFVNERLVLHFQQAIFVNEFKAYDEDHVNVPDITFPDNTATVRTIDNRTNGLFLLIEEQLRLKGSTDQKLAQYFYAQHSSNKIFFAAKSEQKNSEFILKHYTGNVKYDINGFLSRNRNDPPSEVIACLKSSSSQFIREELAFHCEQTSGSSRLSMTSISETSNDPPESVVQPPPPVPEKRPSLVKSRSAAFIPDPEKQSPGRGLSRAASMVSRNGSLKAQQKTLTQLTVSYVNDILTESLSCRTLFCVCLKLNNASDPTTFDPIVVARQLRAYNILDATSFYLYTYPHKLSIVDFLDIFSPISLITTRDTSLVREFLRDLISCRSQENKSPQNQLVLTLIKLFPDLPELEYECHIIRGKTSRNETLLESVTNGVKVGEKCVYMTALSYYYLSGALQLAMRLLGLSIWNFYLRRRFTDDQKVAGMKIGILMKKFLVRREERKKTARLATIAMTQLALKRMRDAKRIKAENPELVSEVSTPAEVRAPDAGPEIQPSLSSVSIVFATPSAAETSQAAIEEEKVHVETVSTAPNTQTEVSIVETPALTSVNYHEPPLSNSLTLLAEQEALIRSLREENVTLKRQVVTLSSMLAEATRSPSPPKIHQSVSRIGSSGVPSSPKPSPPPYNPARKVLKTQSSSLETFSMESVYGGELSRDLEPTVTELKPEYEVFVERTLRSLKEDISFLLVPTPFYKFGRTGSCHQTYIQLTPNFQSLTWVPHSTLTKSRDECIVHLRSVWRLVEGQSTLPFESYKGLSHGPMPPQRSFSIIYGFRSLDLCAMDDEIYHKWFAGLRYILQLMNGDIQEAGFDRQYLRKKWNSVDKKNRGFLSRREVIQLIASMDILFDRASFTTAVMRSTIGHSLNNEITFSQFDSLVYQLRRRPDLEIIWNRIINGYDFSSPSFQPLCIDSEFDSGQLQDVLSVSDVRAFWKASQGRDLSENEAKALIAEGMGEMHQPDFPVLSYNGFINIMTHVKNDGYDPVLTLHHARDMNYPLQHYFISCSDGVDVDVPKKAVKSNSLLEDSHRPNCYANALTSGCRALELRCYEARIAPTSDNVDVFVGSRKVATRITFKETIIHIQRAAFLHTQFPLILMLEISCGIYQQRRIANILRKVFGDQIFTPLEAKSKLLPSPADLKNRVVIFLSHRKKDIESAYKVIDEEPAETKFDDNGSPVRGSTGLSNRELLKSNSSTLTTDYKTPGEGDSHNWFNDMKYYSDLDSDASDREFTISKPLNTVRQQNTPKTLDSGPKYHVVDPEISPSSSFRKADQNDDGAIDSSLMRLCHYSKGHKLSTHNLKLFLQKLEDDSDAEDAIIQFNLTKFSCIYMDTLTKSYGSYGGICSAWDCGVSMVSICREYPSLGTKLIHGKFRQNGGCGYILKPEKYRYRSSEPLTPDVPLTLAVHIISGQELPEAVFDPESGKVSKEKGYAVVIDLNAASIDQDDIQAKTLYIKKHGRNPFWNELFTFAIRDRSRGQLTLRVFHNEECVCFTSVPLNCMRVGYRSMTLFEENEDNNYQTEMLPMSKLFLRIGFLTTDESGAVVAASPLQSAYSKEFSPSTSPSPPQIRSRDHNSRMVGMDVSPGNKQWKRLQSRNSSDTIPEEPNSGVNLNVEQTSKSRHSDRYRHGSTGDSSSFMSSPSRSAQRERRKSSSRTEGRSKRDKGSSSRSQSIDA